MVDAETLVKNDKLVEDNILTYSNGFIKTYTEVEGSKKFQSGIHRIKIKATVVTGSVVDKLKADKITIKEVDGKGLFSEVISKLESEKEAAAIIEKHMKSFPQSCMKASIRSKHEIVESNGTNTRLKLTVQVEHEIDAYKKFIDGIISILEKASIHKGVFIEKYEINSLSEKDKYQFKDGNQFYFRASIKNQTRKPGENSSWLRRVKDEIEKKGKVSGLIFVVDTGKEKIQGSRLFNYYFFNFSPNIPKNDIQVEIGLLDENKNIITKKPQEFLGFIIKL